MNDEEMLKKDMDAMSYEEVLDLLRCHQDLSRFDANTGEIDSLHYMKTCTNELNYPVYVAISKCIELIETIINNQKLTLSIVYEKSANIGDDLDNPPVELYSRRLTRIFKQDEEAK